MSLQKWQLKWQRSQLARYRIIRFCDPPLQRGSQRSPIQSPHLPWFIWLPVLPLLCIFNFKPDYTQFILNLIWLLSPWNLPIPTCGACRLSLEECNSVTDLHLGLAFKFSSYFILFLLKQSNVLKFHEVEICFWWKPACYMQAPNFSSHITGYPTVYAIIYTIFTLENKLVSLWRKPMHPLFHSQSLERMKGVQQTTEKMFEFRDATYTGTLSVPLSAQSLCTDHIFEPQCYPCHIMGWLASVNSNDRLSAGISEKVYCWALFVKIELFLSTKCGGSCTTTETREM